ncbi:hypothetical protein HAX54_025255 [Datura stramonium]|uniref:Uncharacterized protein n=1 Tax=Datura stramonium TaxID=4076 RepID=A0ABS8V0D6_DATST|nr:hypothetical protein [Datura stramonium]
MEVAKSISYLSTFVLLHKLLKLAPFMTNNNWIFLQDGQNADNTKQNTADMTVFNIWMNTTAPPPPLPLNYCHCGSTQTASVFATPLPQSASLAPWINLKQASPYSSTIFTIHLALNP